MRYVCEFCKHSVRTPQGLSSHISQNVSCRQRSLEKYTTSAAELPPNAPEDAQAGVDVPIYDFEDLPLNLEPAFQRAPIGLHEPHTESDSEDDTHTYWVEDYPKPAGCTYGTCTNSFSKHQGEQEKKGHLPWSPFANYDEWQLAQWLMTAGISQKKIDSFLALPIVEDKVKPSFHNARALLKQIDQLPTGPKFQCKVLEITGDEKDENGAFRTETLEVLFRDPVAVVQELIENPFIGEKNMYTPYKVYRDQKRTNREFGEMASGNWWENTQKKLPVGATVVPVILSSDKTSLTAFSGDKQAYPIYMGIGTTPHETRRQSSAHAMILLGYIPVTKLECFSEKRRSAELHQLFHDCMQIILEPLIAAGTDGVRMRCADGYYRMVHPIVAAYVADYPEQCLVVGCKENACPICIVQPKQRGDPIYSVPRDPEKTLRTLAQQSHGRAPPAFVNESLRPIKPFWRNLPHCNIFTCITPDILHQLHKGVFKDHVVSWASDAIGGGSDEVDRRFRAMSPHSTLRHFKKGITLTTQWTGTEHKNMEKVFLGVLANATDPKVIRAVRGVLDFIYYASFEVHTEESLAHLDGAWRVFHENKHVFVDLEIRQHFNISKLHNIKHYLDSIRELGSASGFNTEATERLHIDLAKVGYRASNKKGYMRQMVAWVQRQEAVGRFGRYLEWVEMEKQVERVADDSVSDVVVDEKKVGLPRTSQQPAFPQVPITSIARDYAAPDFRLHLASFLREQHVH
ncbi:hypothetical protein H0H92_007076, partial [Tricholoma furcatifolium]